MGCGSSKETQPKSRRQQRTRPHGPASSGTLQDVPLRRLVRTNVNMTAAIMEEVVAAMHRASGTLDYAVIGGVALALYGHARLTSDLDVMIPHGISQVYTSQILNRGLVMTEGGGYGYMASDGRCYGVDVTTDKDVSQQLAINQNTVRPAGTHANIMTPLALLNSKAYAFLTRVGPDKDRKQANDVNDLDFLLGYLLRHRVQGSPQACRWVVDYDFWTLICQRDARFEGRLRALGLRRDATPSQSNRQSRESSMQRSRESSRRSSNSSNRRARRT